jgi:hypothetical protein
MEGRIGRLHCRYCISADSALPLIARLDEVGRQALASYCARALDGVMQDNRTVWIVRSVTVPFTLNGKAVRDDTILARQWAERITIAVTREVAKGSDAANVMRFDDQADFVAVFLSDLLRGSAWQLWYYGAFERFRNQPTGAAALGVLLENRDHVPQVLARLARMGSLESLLTVLGPDGVKRIWSQEVKAGTPDARDALRPVFRTAIDLACQYGAIESLDVTVVDRWLLEYAQAGPLASDWRDAAGLSRAVVGVLEFLRSRGYLRANSAPLQHPAEHQPQQLSPEFDWLDGNLIREFFAALASSSMLSAPRELQSDEPFLLSAAAAPRTLRLLSDLADAIAHELPSFAIHRDDSANSAIRIYSRLVALNSEWSADPFAVHAIDGLLAAAEWMARAPFGWVAPAIAALEARVLAAGVPAGRLHDWLSTRRGAFTVPVNVHELFAGLLPDIRADLARLSTLQSLLASPPGSDVVARYAQLRSSRAETNSLEERSGAGLRTTFSSLALDRMAAEPPNDPSAFPARQFLRTFADDGLELAAAIAAAGVTTSHDVSDLAAGIATRCAGIFLLLRAMADVRIGSLALNAGYPVAPCVMALGLCWAGSECVFHGRLDTGVGLLAGQGADMTLDELREIWQAVPEPNHLRFQLELLRMLLARGVLLSGPVEIHTLTLSGDRQAIVLGCGGLWPMARVLDAGAAPDAVISEMTLAWSSVCAEYPEIVPATGETQAALCLVLEEFGNLPLQVPLADLTLALAANSLLRCWAMWLRQFASSSTPYLLNNFIRRPGSITRTEDGFLVEMASRPLDVVLEMAGYFAPFTARTEPWECNFTFLTRTH